MRPGREAVWTSAEVSRLVTLLAGERSYYESLFEQLPFPAAVLSADLTVQTANHAFWDAFGGPARPTASLLTSHRALALRILQALETGAESIPVAGAQFRLSRFSGGEEILLSGGSLQPPSPAAPPEPGARVERLNDSERTGERWAAYSRLAGGLSHELNNILTVITSYCHLVHEQLAAAGASTEDVEAILKAAGDATRLGSQLVSIGGRHVAHETSVDLNALLARLEPGLREVSGSAVSLSIDLQTGVPAISGDAGQLESAITALMGHAVQVSPAGGAVQISTGSDGSSVLLTIRDSRRWPASEATVDIFEPYTPVPGSRRTVGLETAAAYAIFRSSHATVSAAHGEHGFAVTVRFPARRAPAASREARRQRIAVVDDNLDVRKSVAQTLDRQGYEIAAFENPLEALDYCSSQAVDMLVSDINMPEMSGHELAKRAKALRPSLKVLMISGFADEEIELGEMLDRDMAFLQKPFPPDRLLAAVRALLPESPEHA